MLILILILIVILPFSLVTLQPSKQEGILASNLYFLIQKLLSRERRRLVKIIDCRATTTRPLVHLSNVWGKYNLAEY